MINTTLMPHLCRYDVSRGTPILEEYSSIGESGLVTPVMRDVTEYNVQCNPACYTLPYLMTNDPQALKQLNPQLLVPVEWARDEMFNDMAKATDSFNNDVSPIIND